MIIFQAEDGEEYGVISKMLGGGRVLVDCLGEIDVKTGKHTKINRMCTIRGKLRKRAWMGPGDIVVASVREYNDGRGDIIHKYTEAHVSKLCKLGKIPNEFIHNADNADNTSDTINLTTNKDDFMFTYSDDESNTVGKQNVPNFPHSDDSDSDSNSDSDYDIDGI